MPKSKLFALIGNILRTITYILGLISTFQMISDPSIIKDAIPQSAKYAFTSTDISSMQSFLGAVGIFVQIISGIVLILTWIAYVKIGKRGERGWKIFLLVMGILGCFSLFTILSNPIAGTLSFVGAVMFILAFAVKDPIIEGND